jgi:c-di-GMP-binding flagellar brake protein YcgR
MENTVRVVVNPKDVRRVNRRLLPRYSFTPPLPARVGRMRDEDAIDAKIINLSAGGLRLESPIGLAGDTDYLFEFDIDVDNEIHSLFLTGNIVYEIPLDTGYSYGVKFIDMDEKDEAAGEAPLESLDRTVDLMGLVNKLIVLGEGKD